ncbi:MAG: hypothetical protein ACLTZI_06905 [[Eubacterium] siraeum]
MARLDATGGASAAPTKAMKCCTGFAECETKKCTQNLAYEKREMRCGISH